MPRPPNDDDFSELVHACWPSLYRTAFLLLGDRAEAEDLVQTALAKTYASWRRVRDLEAALLLAGLGLLRGGAEPWRATRWGWAWPMLMLPPIGLLAFLLLAAPGPTRQPADGARRLTGGWSCLVTVCVLVPLLT